MHRNHRLHQSQTLAVKRQSGSKKRMKRASQSQEQHETITTASYFSLYEKDSIVDPFEHHPATEPQKPHIPCLIRRLHAWLLHIISNAVPGVERFSTRSERDATNPPGNFKFHVSSVSATREGTREENPTWCAENRTGRGTLSLICHHLVESHDWADNGMLANGGEIQIPFDRRRQAPK